MHDTAIVKLAFRHTLISVVIIFLAQAVLLMTLRQGVRLSDVARTVQVYEGDLFF